MFRGLVVTLALLHGGLAFKVLGAGFPKTGTNSLASALGTLGLRTYHAGTWHGVHAARWMRVIEAEAVEPLFEIADDLVHAGFDAAVDTPIPSLTIKLLDRFPDARVILMHRDMDTWFESFVEQANTNLVLYRLGLMSEANMDLMKITNAKLYNCSSHPPSMADKASAVKAHRRHIDRIRQRVPAAQLLELNFSQGWVPLCRFLDVPVPSKPFPHPMLSKSAWKRSMIPLTIGLIACVMFGAMIRPACRHRSPKKVN